MNITIEMVGFLTAFVMMLGAGVGFLWKMKLDIMTQITAIAEQNAQSRLDNTKQLHDVEKGLSDKLTETNTQITILQGRVKTIEDK